MSLNLKKLSWDTENTHSNNGVLTFATAKYGAADSSKLQATVTVLFASTNNAHCPIRKKDGDDTPCVLGKLPDGDDATCDFSKVPSNVLLTHTENSNESKINIKANKD